MKKLQDTLYTYVKLVHALIAAAILIWILINQIWNFYKSNQIQILTKQSIQYFQDEKSVLV